MNKAIQPLDSKRIKGLLLSRHMPQIRARDGFLICVRENRYSEPFKEDTGDSGGRARGMRHEV